MPVRRKKALTKAQIAALAAYEPHLSAASRQACLGATKPTPPLDVHEIDGWPIDNGLRFSELYKIEDASAKYGIKNAGFKMKAIVGEEYIVKEPTWTFAIWCPYREHYLASCFAKIEWGDLGLYLEESVVLAPEYAILAIPPYLHLRRDAITIFEKLLDPIAPKTAVLIEEGPLCDFSPV